jgi:predicted anti-sigma-YlaC factor YlaD
MNCRNISEQLPDVALGTTPAPPEVEAHLAECHECAGTLQALRSTMNLLDEWKAPEPSPFWDVRMQARLREEQQRVSTGWLQWLRRPALSVAAAFSLVIGIGLYQAGRFMRDSEIPPAQPVAFHLNAPTGTAVADLQYLDNHSDMLQNFDALDALDGDDDNTGN